MTMREPLFNLLPRPEPIAESEMDPDQRTQELMRAKLLGWKARVERELGTLKEEARRSGRAIELAGSLLAEADKSFEKAKRNERIGASGVPLLNGSPWMRPRPRCGERSAR